MHGEHDDEIDWNKIPYEEIGGLSEKPPELMPTIVELGNALGPGRLFLDYKFCRDPIWDFPLWKNLWTGCRTKLHTLIKAGVWRPHYVAVDNCDLFEDGVTNRKKHLQKLEKG